MATERNAGLTQVSDTGPSSRRNQIVERLNLKGIVRVAELSELFDISEVTVRNDLAELEKEGVLERVHGGAIPSFRSYYNMNFYERKDSRLEEKKRIAAAVSQMIHDGDTVMMNSGTTTHFVACELKNHKNLSILTNSISIAMEIGGLQEIDVILFGGCIDVKYSFLYGDDTLNQLRKYRAEKLILSIDGIDSSCISTRHFLETELNKTMISHVNNVIVVADYSKIGRREFSYISDISSVRSLVTNKQAHPDEIDKLRAKGIDVLLV